MFIDLFIFWLDMFALLIFHSLGFHMRLSRTWIGMNWFNFLPYPTCFEPMNITWYEILYIHVLHAHLFVLPSIFTLIHALVFILLILPGQGCFGGEVSLRGEFGLETRGDRFLRVFFFSLERTLWAGGCFRCDFSGGRPIGRGALESWEQMRDFSGEGDRGKEREGALWSWPSMYIAWEIMPFLFLVGISILDSMVKLAGGLLLCRLRCFSYLQPDVTVLAPGKTN